MLFLHELLRLHLRLLLKLLLLGLTLRHLPRILPSRLLHTLLLLLLLSLLLLLLPRQLILTHHALIGIRLTLTKLHPWLLLLRLHRRLTLRHSLLRLRHEAARTLTGRLLLRHALHHHRVGRCGPRRCQSRRGRRLLLVEHLLLLLTTNRRHVCLIRNDPAGLIRLRVRVEDGPGLLLLLLLAQNHLLLLLHRLSRQFSLLLLLLSRIHDRRRRRIAHSISLIGHHASSGLSGRIRLAQKRLTGLRLVDGRLNYCLSVGVGEALSGRIGHARRRLLAHLMRRHAHRLRIREDRGSIRIHEIRAAKAGLLLLLLKHG